MYILRILSLALARLLISDLFYQLHLQPNTMKLYCDELVMVLRED